MEEPQKTPLDNVKQKLSNLTEEKKWSLLCYLPFINVITCLLTAVKMVDSESCRFHARQGLMIFIFLFIAVLVALFSQIVSLMLWGIVILLYITALVFTYQGKQFKIPLLASLAMKIPEYYLFEMLTGKSPEKPENKDTK